MLDHRFGHFPQPCGKPWVVGIYVGESQYSRVSGVHSAGFCPATECFFPWHYQKTNARRNTLHRFARIPQKAHVANSTIRNVSHVAVAQN